MSENTFYLDDAATAPVRCEVKSRFVEMLDVFGNPSSLHRVGMQAETVLRDARETLFHLLDGKKGRLLFTGSGTEANNLAILGAAMAFQKRGKHLVTTAIEHPAVLEPFRALERLGWEVTYVLPNRDGDILMESIQDAVRPDTVLISAMHVNNETGALLPIQQLSDWVAEHKKIRLHVDGTQAFGKIPVSLDELGVDFYTISSHKIGGLKGTGALFVRDGARLEPVLFGGGQEYGLRSGTENVLGADAFATAAKATLALPFDLEASYEQNEWFVRELRAIPGWTVHRPSHASPFIVHASLTGLRGEVIVHAFEQEGLYVSSGSACSTAGGKQKRSHVLVAMGMSKVDIEGAVRFSWNRETTREALADALEIVKKQSAWLVSMVGV